MSLKHVHLAFIVAATLLALFCSVDAFVRYRVDGSPLVGLAALGALGLAAALVRYELHFVRRCREMGIR